MSRTPHIRPSARRRGMTISEWVLQSQAMCPAKQETSSTTWERSSLQAVPQTPLPYPMRLTAGFPWKGPSTSSSPSMR